jgi:hypothetical protein
MITDWREWISNIQVKGRITLRLTGTVRPTGFARGDYLIRRR